MREAKKNKAKKQGKREEKKDQRKLQRGDTDERIKAVKVSFLSALSMTKHNFEDDAADFTFRMKQSLYGSRRL